MRSWITRTALVVVLLLATGCTPFGGDQKTIVAQFSSAAGLFTGNDVGVLGVPIGKVTKIEPNGEVVDVTMEIDPEIDIPADAGAVLVSRSVATDRYIELTPVYKGGPKLEDDAQIPVQRTRVPVEFDEVLKTVNDLASALSGTPKNPGAMGEVLEVAAENFKGDGKRFARTITSLSKGLKSLNGNSDSAVAVLQNLDTLAATYARNDATVRAFLKKVTQATALFAEQRHDMEAAFDALTRALQQVAIFVKANRARMKSGMVDLTRVIENILKHQVQLTESIENLPLVFQNIDRAVDPKTRTAYVRLPLNKALPPTDVIVDALCQQLPADVCDAIDLTDGVSLAEMVWLSGRGGDAR